MSIRATSHSYNTGIDSWYSNGEVVKHRYSMVFSIHIDGQWETQWTFTTCWFKPGQRCAAADGLVLRLWTSAVVWSALLWRSRGSTGVLQPQAGFRVRFNMVQLVQELRWNCSMGAPVRLQTLHWALWTWIIRAFHSDRESIQRRDAIWWRERERERERCPLILGWNCSFVQSRCFLPMTGFTALLATPSAGATSSTMRGAASRDMGSTFCPACQKHQMLNCVVASVETLGGDRNWGLARWFCWFCWFCSFYENSMNFWSQATSSRTNP